ncbi:MAG: hypothetical protein HQL42_02455 [Alphaproteobacteria bacterium]|nr:hypothetical protein [Alphaproteobacteria bacterium]
MSILAVLLQTAATFGLGAVVLRLLRLDRDLTALERLAWAWGAGFATFGWLLFFPALFGLTADWVFLALLAAGLPGLSLLRPGPRLEHRAPHLADGAPAAIEAAAKGADAPARRGAAINLNHRASSGWTWAVAGLLAAAAGLDLAEALVPPADADSLAYHFARPREILELGRLLPVARAVDGATPMLAQMTYLPALALGGERGLTLWTGLSGWLALLPLFALARRWLTAGWALTLVALVATVPAWVYGAGSGQVEARIAPLVLLALFATIQAARGRDLRWAALAGLLAGAYAGAKFFGLPFAALCGLAVLTGRRLAPAAAFALVAAAMAGPWYLFHAATLGDPIFPLLHDILGQPGPPLWDDAHAATLKATYSRSETDVPANLAWLLGYPLVASILPMPVWEAGRTGLGGFGLLATPFAIAAAWRARATLWRSPLAPLALLAAVFYAVWFLSGTSQRIRHLLPLYPVIALLLLVAAERFTRATPARPALIAGIAVVLAVQLAGQALFSLTPLRALAGGYDRDRFYDQVLIHHAPVPWINTALKSGDRLVTGERQLLYLLPPNTYFAHETFQAQLNLLPDGASPERDLQGLARLNITHILYSPDPATGLGRLAARLEADGCLRPLAAFSGKLFLSRTLGLGASETPFAVAAIEPRCLRRDGKEGT